MKDVKDDADLAATLRAEAELAEPEEDIEDDVWVPRKPTRHPSMVYSVRIPVARVEELRRVAAEAGLDPSAMVRQWVLERLDAERSKGELPKLQALEHLEHLLETMPSLAGWGVLLTPEPDRLKPFFVDMQALEGSQRPMSRAAAAAPTKKPAAKKAAAAKKAGAQAAKSTGKATAVQKKVAAALKGRSTKRDGSR